MWDLEERKVLQNLQGHATEVLSVDFGPGATTCASVGRDNILRLWELDSGQCLLTLEAFAGHAAPIKLSADGRYCLWGGWDRALRFWSLGTPWPKASLMPAEAVSSEDALQRQSLVEELKEKANAELARGHLKAAGDLVIEARRIPGHAREAELMELWHRAGTGARARALKNGWRLRTFKSDNPPTAATFSPDSRFILIGDSRGALSLWDVQSGEKCADLEGHSSVINSISVSGRSRIALSGSGLGRGGDTSARLWDLEGRKQLSVFECSQGANAVAISPDARLALIGTSEVLREAPLRLLNLKTGEAVQDFEEHSEPVTSVDFHPSGQFAVSGYEDASVALWDARSGRSLLVYSGHSELITSVVFSPNGRSFLSSSLDGTLRLWDISRAQAPRILNCSDAVTSATFTPDGHFVLLGCMDKTLQLWSVATGENLRVFEGHTQEVKAVEVSPDGRFALSASTDRSILLWALDWDYEFPESGEDPSALHPFLENFLAAQSPSQESAVEGGLRPQWSEEDLGSLLEDLRRRGFGWVSPDTIRGKLEEMARAWSPPKLL